MVILALDTSGATASAALMDEYIILAESSVTLKDLRGGGRKTHSETLMPMVDRVFKTTGMALEDVDYIACTCGPGSFTGLRIGVAAAKGLAFATGKPLVAVPTLDALAYNVTGITAPCTWVVPMLDARRGQVYSALYCMGHRQTDYVAVSVQDLLEMVKGSQPPQKSCRTIFLGDGASAYGKCIGKEEWGDHTIIDFAPPSHNLVRVACVGAQALKMLKCGQSFEEGEFSLLYIRRPQAQREREKKGEFL